MKPFVPSCLSEVLLSTEPATEHAAKMNLYGRFIGRWDMDVVAFEESGAEHRSQGEIWFGWALEGRAIQDVWMIPPCAQRHLASTTAMPVTGNWYGTTLRVYDPGIDAWHIFWIDPATQFYSRQLGRPRGLDIVQEGTLESGAKTRWSFTEIKENSFRWLGEVSTDSGATWRRQVDIRARRTGA